MQNKPDFILFAQHGWNDDAAILATLAHAVASSRTHVVLPDLGWIRTWIDINTLISTVEEIASSVIEEHPSVPIRIIGHSLGGLIWIELLHRHRDWWPRIDSFILLGSPIGGADLARITDPFEMFPTIARDLGRNRRTLAEVIAANIKTLVISGDSDGGSDQVIVEGATSIKGSQHISVQGLWHNDLREHPTIIALIRTFWSEEAPEDERENIISLLRNVQGMTDAHRRDFDQAHTSITCTSGLTIRTWKNPLGVDHVFVADKRGQYIYGGFVGWVHAKQLRACLSNIGRLYSR